MRVGIIRGDLPGPLFMADLEPTSQMNFPTESSGQTRYVARPGLTNVAAVMGTSAGAGFSSTANITTPVTINAGNQTLRARTSAAASYSVILIPTGVYASLAALIAAANAVLVTYGMALEVNPANAARLVLYSLTFGPGSYIELDTVGNGSTFNGVTAGSFGAGGGNFTVPSAATFITATLPVGGPLDVRAATIRTQLGPALTDAQVKSMADSIAPQFIETDVAVKSFEVGDLAGYLRASYSPDPNRLPAIATGAAITVVQDDGFTAFVATVPTISGTALGTPSAGDVTITGTGLGNSEYFNATEVKVTHTATGRSVTLKQRVIVATLTGGTQGVVSATSIVIPASLIPGTVAGDKVQVKFTSLASGVATL